MAQLGEAIARYHKLLEQPVYRDLAWADQLQAQMRERHLTESGRLLAPVLRPCFISRRQLEALTKASEHLAEILDQVEAMAVTSATVRSRLQMLPAEKMLAATPPGYSRFGVTWAMWANVCNGCLSLKGIEACKPAGLAYSNPLADLFLELPIIKEFKRGRYRLSKLGGPRHLLSAVQAAWREFGGKTKPFIAIVELSQDTGAVSEGALLAEALTQLGAAAQVVLLERLSYSGGKLRAGAQVVDVVFRRLLTRELLARWDLSHPLLLAYREGAVCVINSFRAEFAQRRALFDLLTDEKVTAHLPMKDRKMIRDCVSWTRVVSARKTRHGYEEIDLPEFILRKRESLTLLPSDDSADGRTFVGADMTQAAWDRALRLALRTPYVVQERTTQSVEIFPVYQYGELKMKEAEVAIHPYVFNGQMHGTSAILQSRLAGSVTHLAVAPVLLLEEN